MNFIFPPELSEKVVSQRKTGKTQVKMKSCLLDIYGRTPTEQKSKAQRLNGHLIFKGIYMPSPGQTPTDFQMYSVCILTKILKGKIPVVQIPYL